MTDDCLFCKIFNGEIPSNRVYENNNVIGFKDIHPLAPIHLIFIHKKHTKDFNDFCKTDANGVLELLKAISEYAEKNGLNKSGYRLVTNIGESSGQSIFHTHFHLLSGSKLGKFGT